MKTEVIENYITMNKNLNAIDFIKAIKRISYDFEGHTNPVQRPIKGQGKKYFLPGDILTLVSMIYQLGISIG